MVVAITANLKRPAQLYFRESEPVAKTVRCTRQAFQFFAPPRIKKLHLAGARGKCREFHAYQPQFCRTIPGAREEIPNCAQKDRIQVRWLRERLAASNGRKIRIAKCNRNGASVQPRIAQALGRFLAQMAQRGLQ